MIEEGLILLIQQDPTVSGLVSMTNGNGVYGILAPKQPPSIPYLVVNRVTTNDTYTMAGADGLREVIFQIDCYATTWIQSRQVAQAVRMLLEDYQGNLPDTDSTAVAQVMTDKDWDMPYEEGPTQLGFVYRALLQFRVWHYDSTLPITPTASGPATIDGGTW
jgi:hypothetical protein